jgi:hypothetical protein
MKAMCGSCLNTDKERVEKECSWSEGRAESGTEVVLRESLRE